MSLGYWHEDLKNGKICVNRNVITSHRLAYSIKVYNDIITRVGDC